MADVPRSSFIPKQTPGGVPGRVRKRKRFHVFGFLATLVFVASLILSGMVFFYKDYVTKQLIEEQEALAAERDRFDPSRVAELQEFNRRIDAAAYLLDTHMSPSKVFDALELSTKERVQFVSFAYDRQESGNVSVSVSGATEEFKTVALQELQFGRDPVFKNAVVTALAESGGLGTEGGSTNTGKVDFEITSNLSSSNIAYDGRPSVPLPDDATLVDDGFEDVADTVTTEDIVTTENEDGVVDLDDSNEFSDE